MATDLQLNTNQALNTAGFLQLPTSGTPNLVIPPATQKGLALTLDPKTREFIGQNQTPTTAVLNGTGKTVDKTPPTGEGFMNVASGIADIAGAATGLAGAYLSYKNYQLAEDQADFAKNLANRNIATQGQQYNTALENAARVGLALGGSAVTDEQRAQALAETKANYVDTSKIG